MEKKIFESIFNKLYEPLCNYACKYLGDYDSAEDIVQSVFMKLLEQKQLADIQEPERYLLRSVKFKCIDHLRSKSRRPEISYPPDELPEPIFENHQDSDLDRLAMVTFLLALLPEKTREVFILSRQSGLTYREIAEELAISVKTVENQMGRALKTLRLQYQRYLHRQH